MARVAVIGAGLAGLTAALYAVTAGHHVVVLDKTDRLGGRAASQTVDGVPFGFGPHLILKNGPLRRVVKKISRLKTVLATPRLDRIHLVGMGPFRPRNDVRLAAQIRRALRSTSLDSPFVRGAGLLAGSGVPTYDARFIAFKKSGLAVVGEGWAGLVGRMASALDEVGVLIEPHCHVSSIEDGCVLLKDGRSFQSDTIVVACGLKQARNLLASVDEHALSEVSTVRASTLDVALSSRPLGEKHGIVDVEQGAYVLDVSNIQPKLGLDGAYLSALMVEKAGEPTEERDARFEMFLERHAQGWKHHVRDERRQRNIAVQTVGTKPKYDAYAEKGILLAGEWVSSDHSLSDAAVDTGRMCGQNIP